MYVNIPHSRQEEFSKKPSKQEYLKFCIEQKDVCRYCKKLVAKEDACLSASYWLTVWHLAHKDCRVVGEKDEAYECQCIDADCNDCKHFERGERWKNSKQSSNGWCSNLSTQKWWLRIFKIKKKVAAHVKFCSSHECFEHRNSNA